MSDEIPSWEKIRIAPCIVRILAKTKDGSIERLKTDAELMQQTGWTRWRLVSVYQSATWNDVSVGDMNKFLFHCGLRPSTQRRSVWTLHRAYRSKEGLRSMKHLRPKGIGQSRAWTAKHVNTLIAMVERVLSNEYSS